MVIQYIYTIKCAVHSTGPYKVLQSSPGKKVNINIYRYYIYRHYVTAVIINIDLIYVLDRIKKTGWTPDIWLRAYRQDIRKYFILTQYTVS